jgi:hypothetical protein
MLAALGQLGIKNRQAGELTVEIEGEPKPALICEWITQFFV